MKMITLRDPPFVGGLAAAACAVQLASPNVRADDVDQATAAPHVRADLGPLSRVVRYDDLNLSSENGMQTLVARIRVAVDRVCDPAGPHDLRDLRRSQMVRECKAAAFASAMAQVHDRTDRPARLADDKSKCEAPQQVQSVAQVREPQ